MKHKIGKGSVVVVTGASGGVGRLRESQHEKLLVAAGAALATAGAAKLLRLS